MFTEKEIYYIDCCKKTGSEKGDCQQLRDLAKAAYSDYKKGVISGAAYDRINAICMEYAYPR